MNVKAMKILITQHLINKAQLESEREIFFIFYYLLTLHSASSSLRHVTVTAPLLLLSMQIHRRAPAHSQARAHVHSQCKKLFNNIE